jgi:hypothetical protein
VVVNTSMAAETGTTLPTSSHRYAGSERHHREHDREDRDVGYPGQVRQPPVGANDPVVSWVLRHAGRPRTLMRWPVGPVR